MPCRPLIAAVVLAAVVVAVLVVRDRRRGRVLRRERAVHRLTEGRLVRDVRAARCRAAEDADPICSCTNLERGL